MKSAIRLLLTLLTILSCATIAGAAVQEAHVGVDFEKACVLEGKTHFSASLVAARTGGPNSTRLFRAVEGDELADVMRYGDYNIHPNSTFKRFAFDEKSLDDFIRADPNRTYTKTYIDVPTENLGQMYRHPDPGGVGRSIGIDVFENPQFYDWFDKVNIIPR